MMTCVNHLVYKDFDRMSRTDHTLAVGNQFNNPIDSKMERDIAEKQLRWWPKPTIGVQIIHFL